VLKIVQKHLFFFFVPDDEDDDLRDESDGERVKHGMESSQSVELSAVMSTCILSHQHGMNLLPKGAGRS